MLQEVVLLHIVDHRLDQREGNHVHSSNHRMLDPTASSLLLCEDVLVLLAILPFSTWVLLDLGLLVVLQSCPSDW